MGVVRNKANMKKAYALAKKIAKVRALKELLMYGEANRDLTEHERELNLRRK